MKDANNIKEKCSKDMNKQFTEEKTHIAKKKKKQEKRYLNYLVVREIQIKTTRDSILPPKEWQKLKNLIKC